MTEFPHRTDLLLIVPHPDDEVFGIGGLLTKMAAHGRTAATLTLTRGGAGRTLGLCDRHELKEVRERELRASLETLMVQHVHIWDYPDYVPEPDRGMDANPGLQGVDAGEAVGRIRALLEELSPRVVVTFAPNGSNGHPDHVTTHRWTMDALEESPYAPERLYYFASERPYSGVSREGFLDAEAIRSLHLPPTHVLEVAPFIENKIRAMGQHETQARSVMNFMRLFPRRLLVETFHRAVPDVPAGHGPATVEWL